MRSGIFAIGAIILVLGLLIVVNYQYPVSAVESMFGGWAMLSEVHQERVAYLYMGYMIVVIGIIIMIPGIILKTESGETKKEDESTFKYKDEEIQPDSKLPNDLLAEKNSKQVPPKEPKSDLKKSPTQKGTIIAIIAALIVVIVIIGYASESPPQTTQQETTEQTELNTNKESTPQQKTSPQTIQSDCDPNYSGVCIPVDSHDVDCSDFSRSFKVVGLDHHQLDSNGDGIAC